MINIYPSTALISISPPATGPSGHRPIQTDIGPALACLNRHQSKQAGPYRLSNGLCWCRLVPVPSLAERCRCRGNDVTKKVLSVG